MGKVARMPLIAPAGAFTTTPNRQVEIVDGPKRTPRSWAVLMSGHRAMKAATLRGANRTEALLRSMLSGRTRLDKPLALIRLPAAAFDGRLAAPAFAGKEI